MELQEIQTLWKRKLSSPGTKTREEIGKMIRLKSRSIVGQLKQSVWFELTVTLILSMLLFSYVFTAKDGVMQWMTLSLLTLFLVFIYTYARKLMILGHFPSGDISMKENLSGLIARIDRYIIFFYRSYVILYPLFFCLAFVFLGLDKGWAALLEKFMNVHFLINLLTFIAAYVAIVFWLTRWYLRKLFGDYLHQLKDVLAELARLEEHTSDNNANGNL